MSRKTPRSRSLTVAVDGRSLNRPHVRGIGRYLLRVLQSEAARGIRWIVFGDRPDLPVWISESDNVALDIFDFRGDRFHAWEQIALPAKARMASADVLFCPAGTAPAWQPVPTVITLHDIIPWIMDGEEFRAGWYRDRVLPGAFRRASAMMSPSAHSVRDIVARWPTLEPKVTVVPNGVDEIFLSAKPGQVPDTLIAAGVKQPYVLYVGGEIPRKRPEWALDVWREATHGAAQFVACGVNISAREALRNRLPPELRPGVQFINYVSDAELAAIYANAAIVLYPTLYEGFGLPAVEAQACGTPVVFSAVGSLTELAGPGTVVLPVDDRNAWVAACREHLHRSAGVTIPNEAARSWAAKFSWTSTAARVVDVLFAAAGKSVSASLRECAL